jgi:K+/H+ antiporter YhaU regulatory subunit KhtT
LSFTTTARELYHFNRKNLDRPASVLTWTDGEARQIAGIVGGLTYVPKSLPSTEVVLEDLVLEWFTLPQGAVAAGRTISEMQIRTKTGASIVSIIEPNRITRTNPEASTLLNEGATLILAGDLAASGGLLPVLQPFAALYVLILAVLGPLLTKESERIHDLLTKAFKRKPKQEIVVDEESS